MLGCSFSPSLSRPSLRDICESLRIWSQVFQTRKGKVISFQSQSNKINEWDRSVRRDMLWERLWWTGKHIESMSVVQKHKLFSKALFRAMQTSITFLFKILDLFQVKPGRGNLGHIVSAFSWTNLAIICYSIRPYLLVQVNISQKLM